jgi:putative DNA primase/helicase
VSGAALLDQHQPPSECQREEFHSARWGVVVTVPAATIAERGGPDFAGPLSKPYPAAVSAFTRGESKALPIGNPAVSYGLTDVGQAQRFAERYGTLIRFDHSRRVFLRWKSHFWAIDDDGEVKRLAVELAREQYLRADDEPNLQTREAIAKFAVQAQARRKIEDVLELVKVLAPITNAGHLWNADPFLLATPWAVVSLQTGHVRDGQPEDGITFHTNAKSDPLAEAPRWRRFLHEVFADQSLVDYVQRAVGYSATGDMREQVVFLNVGHGSNGKSTFLETIADVLGQYAYAAPFSTFEAGQRSEIGADVAALAGRRFITSSETNARSRFNEARLKALSGGDTMNARHLYGNPFEFHPVGKIWLAVNHKPTVADDSYGFWRRLHVIPFEQTFSGSADDKTLKATLRSEASGILNWIIEGAMSWQRDGLNPPSCVLAARDAYQREEDPIGDFLDEACIFGQGMRSAASQVWTAYQAWCQQQSVKGLGRKQFGQAMAKRVESRHAEFGRMYVGVGLKG